MPELQEFKVRLSSGMTGTVQRTSRFLDKREFNTVKLSNGAEITVPSASLEPQQDGTFLLQDGKPDVRTQIENRNATAAGNTTGEDQRNEELANIDASLLKEEVDVQRVPVNRVIDAPLETRVEDGVTIIPVMEERLKVEKQLILKEEIRIVKKRRSVRGPQTIALGKDAGEVNPRG